MQFPHLVSRYEVCGHKWAAVCEYDQGLAVINDSKYGHSCEGGMLRLSLLRAPKAPDRTADIGQHQVREKEYKAQ
jgi:alpha-mannosidase